MIQINSGGMNGLFDQFKDLGSEFFNIDGFKVSVRPAVNRLAFGQDFILAHSAYFIMKLQPGTGIFLNTRADHNFILIPGKSQKSAFQFQQRKHCSLFFDPGVGQSHLSDEIRPAGLKPYRVMGMMNHAHLVRFRISDDKNRF